MLVPTFNDPADREALDTLAGLFPGREVVGVHAVDLVWGLGTLHCLTREQPSGTATATATATAEEVSLEIPGQGEEAADAR